VYLLLVVNIYASIALSRQALVENEFAAFKSSLARLIKPMMKKL